MRIIDVVLWIVQVLLAVAFFAHGMMFLNPPPELVEVMDASVLATFVAYMRARVRPHRRAADSRPDGGALVQLALSASSGQPGMALRAAAWPRRWCWPPQKARRLVQ